MSIKTAGHEGFVNKSKRGLHVSKFGNLTGVD
jgi:hypothetical protein